jgi:hypothetical protein
MDCALLFTSGNAHHLLELPDFFGRGFSNLLIIKEIIFFINEGRCSFGCSWSVAQISFRSLKRILDHTGVRFTANPKLALWAQTLDLRSFRLTKNG